MRKFVHWNCAGGGGGRVHANTLTFKLVEVRNGG